MKKRIISLVLFMALLLQLSGGISFATDPEDGVSWDLDGSTLYIYGEGSGVMEDYQVDTYETRAPWSDYAKAIQKVVVEEGVTYIGDYAFADCTMLQFVYLPDSLTGIGEGAFYNCSYLQSVDIPDSVTAIGEGAFLDCTYLDSVELPSKLARIEAMTFMSCECLTEITVPASVSYIGDYAFGYSGMSTVTMLGSEPELGEDVFIKEDADFQLVTYAAWPSMLSNQWGLMVYSGVFASGNCGAEGDNLTWALTAVYMDGYFYRLTISGEGAMEDYGFTTSTRPWEKYAAQISELNLPDGLTTIGGEAFYMFSSAEEIIIPAGVTEIGQSAFASSSFDTVIFKGDVPSISSDAFSGVVADCYYPANNSSWQEYFDNLENETNFGGKLMWNPLYPEPNEGLSFAVKNGVLTVSGKGFLDYPPYDLPPYDKVIIEQGVTGIQDYAFSWMSISTVEIPASVTYVGEGAFDECLNLAEVHFAGDAPQIGSNAFGPAKVTVYYPEDAAGWDAIVNAEPGTYGNAVTWVSVGESGGEIGPVEPPSAPQPVTDITAFVSEDDEIIVQWVYDHEGEYSFNVYRSTSEDGEFSLMSSSCIGTFTDTALSAHPGISYYYYVTAVSGGAESDKGTVVSAALPTDKTPPTIVDVWPVDNVTLCKQATFQISAKDNYSLFAASVEIIPTDSDVDALFFDQILKTKENSALFSFDVDLSQLPGGTYYVNYTVIDSSGMAASRSATVTVRGYASPAAPIVSAQAGYKTAQLSWTYSGDMGVMDHFAVYSCDENGENLRFVTSVRSFKCSVDIPKGETQYFIVEAIDMYGESCRSEVIAVSSPEREYVKPVAVISPENITGTLGQEVTFSGVNSTDNDAIASYTWDFGDGSSAEGDVCTHTYTKAGSYTVKLTVTDESGNVGVSTKTVDVYDISGADATHALMTITVKNAYEVGTPVLSGVTVTVYTADRSFETSGVTRSDGSVQLVVPLGEVVVAAGIAGFIPDSKTFEVVGDAQGRFTCFMGLRPLDVSVVDGSLTVTEMTMDEIIEAGIDVSAPENQHVWKFAVILEFVIDGEPRQMPVSGYVNENGEVIKSPDFWRWNWDETDDDKGPGEDAEEWFEDLPFEIGVFPVAKNIYLVIYGQAHWLKEMFNVELLVANNNQMYPITDCVATLDLPKGMSLAAMIDGAQSETIRLGQIAPGKTTKANWYVCGDEVGEYFLTASVSGLVDGDSFSTEFKTDKPVKVYAGEALCMYVSCDQYAAKGLTYTVDFELQNVSHKELYNVGMEIFGAEFFAALDMQEIIDKVQSVGYQGGGEEWRWADGAKLFAETLKPGESLKGTFEIRFAEDLAEAGVRYFLNRALALTMEGSTTVVPVEFRIRDNTFRYNSTACGNTDNQTNYIYEDEYFFQSAEIFNPQLAYATACLSVAGYNSSDAAAGGYTAEAAGKNVKDLLEKMGFAPENIELESRTASYAGKPREDSIAAAIASKPLTVGEEDYTLIAVVVRGGAYEREWHDNFLVSTNTDHKGFSNAANNVISALNEYIENRGITGKVKLWITGYSRSSATANLAAARIVDGALADSVSLAHGDLYAYGFATPAGTTSGAVNDARYSTIYSIVNPVDVVPMVAPGCWGFDRYGKTFYLPSAGLSDNYNDYHELLLSTYAYITGGKEYGLDKFQMKKFSVNVDVDLDYEFGSGFDVDANVTFVNDDNNSGLMQEAFLLEFTEILFEDGFKDTWTYTAFYQEAVCDLASIICADADVRDKFIADFGEAFDWGSYGELFMKGLADDYIKATIRGTAVPPPDDDSVVVELLEKFEHDLATFISGYDGINVSYDYARNLVKMLEGVLLRCIVMHINYTLTMVYNGSYVGMAHYPDVYLSWMRLIQNEDSYDPTVWDDILINERPSYRKVTVNCPVNVEVYDAEGNMVAQILEVAKENGGTEKKVTKIEGSTVIAYVDANDQMVVYLPYNGEYDVRISANSDGELNYSITEINLGSGEKDKICYNSIPIKAGDVLTGTVSEMTPAAEDGQYTLTGPDNREIEPGEALTDEEISFHYVELEAEGEGYIMGGGSIEHGNFAKMIAIPEENYVFRGWFVGDELLSTQRELRMTVTEDVTVTAKFVLIDGSRYKIDSLALISDGTELENIPKGSFTAAVGVTNRLVESGDAVVVLAAYTADGQFRWMTTAPVSGCLMGQSAQIELAIDNAYEDIAQIRAFVMAADGCMTPLSQAAAFSAK